MNQKHKISSNLLVDNDMMFEITLCTCSKKRLIAQIS